MYKYGNDKATQKINGKSKNPHRSKMSALDTEGLVKAIQMVNAKRCNIV